MLESAQREVAEIRELALHPSPVNFELISAKLQLLAGFLSHTKASQDPGLLADKNAQEFFSRLPAEMARLRLLMQAPLNFYAGLTAIRAKHFGSYERTGSLRSLEPKPSGKTIMHL